MGLSLINMLGLSSSLCIAHKICYYRFFNFSSKKFKCKEMYTESKNAHTVPDDGEMLKFSTYFIQSVSRL
jgi:hypothetical protein